MAILEHGEKKEVRALFGFDSSDTDDEVLFKFNAWARWFHPQYFMDETKTEVVEDAPFHADIDRGNLRVYRYGGGDEPFIDIAFRGAAKTTRTKLFIAFAISNDLEHRRRYFKVLTKDYGNAKQAVTDIYNLFVNPRVRHYYPEIFEQTVEKRMETTSEFDTSTGVKVRAGTVGQEQRGQLQDDARPDFIWFDDFETRKTLRSAVELEAIRQNMEEARTGLSRSGGAVYTCNYLSERGNVHRLIQKYPKQALIVPIKGRVDLHVSGGNVDARHIDGRPTWSAAYTREAVARILRKADDPAGEYLSSPSAGDDIFFPRKMLDRMEKKKPIKEIAGFKIFHPYDPSHRYGCGNDVGGGVGLDSSTSVFIDFTQFPNRVAGTYKCNTIKPDIFGDEIKSQAKHFGNPIVAPENNNHGHATIGRLKQIYDNIYTMREKTTRAGTPTKVRQWGWNTNRMTKPEAFMAFRKAIADGHLELSDPDLIAEARAYTRDDLMDEDKDPRLATRHFDLLMAAVIAHQMQTEAEAARDTDGGGQAEYEAISEYENTDHRRTGQKKTERPPVRFDHMPEEDYTQPAYEPMSDFEQ